MPSLNGRKKPTKRDHKYSRGVVGIIAGSERFPGAGVLTTGAARRSGAGYVKYFSKSISLCNLIISQYPDVVPIRKLTDEQIDALVVGPGAVSLRKLPQFSRIVLDGAAMKLVNTTAKLKRINQNIVLTPHEGELSILGYAKPGDESKRKEIAQQIADELGVVVVLKGHRTVIAAPNLAPIIDSLGGPELATAGSGDVLAGVIGGFLASWKPTNLTELQKVVASAVRLHSKAGQEAAKKHSSVVATDLLEALAHC